MATGTFSEQSLPVTLTTTGVETEIQDINRSKASKPETNGNILADYTAFEEKPSGTDASPAAITKNPIVFVSDKSSPRELEPTASIADFDEEPSINHNRNSSVPNISTAKTKVRDLKRSTLVKK